MQTEDQLKEYTYDTILELGLATREELELVTSINGFNVDAMNDIVYVREGYKTLDQYVDYLDSQS